MIAAKIHTDRAREDLTPKSTKRRDTKRKKEMGAGKEGGNDEQAEVFRASRAAAMKLGDNPTARNNSVSFKKTNRNRSSVVAVVVKRVEMLHMNTICREFSPLLVRTRV